MELQGTISDAGVVYLPRELRESLGKHVRLLPDSLAAIIYGADTPLEEVRESVNILLQDIELRIKSSKNAAASAQKRKQ